MGRNSRTFHRRQLPFLWHRELYGRWNARPRQTDTGSHTANRQMQRGPIPETGGKEQETQQELTTLHWQYNIRQNAVNSTNDIANLSTTFTPKHWENGSNCQSNANKCFMLKSNQTINFKLQLCNLWKLKYLKIYTAQLWSTPT